MSHEVLDLDAARHSPHVARKRRTRIREILGAALDIAADEGRDALTLKRLAERLGLTTTALYRYFPSKDALVAELQRAVIHALARSTRECVDAAEADALAKGYSDDERMLLGVVVSAFAFERFAHRAPVEFGILSMNLSAPEYSLPEREAAQVFEAAWSALTELAERLRLAQEGGVLAAGDASGRAVGLWAGLQGVAQTRKLARSASDRIDSTRISHDLIQALLVGWGATPALASRMIEATADEGFAEASTSTHEYLENLDDTAGP